MASPTLSSPTPAPRKPCTFEAAVSCMGSYKTHQPKPQAASRSFFQPRLPAVQPVEAKTEKVGFLHLPDEVRERIYKLAIFDRDRSAVFLPRNHPRKVEPGVDDVDVTCVNPACASRGELLHLESSYAQCCHLISHSEEPWTAAAGEWIGPEALRIEEALGLDISYNELVSMLDWEIVKVLESAEEAESDDEDQSGSEDEVHEAGPTPTPAGQPQEDAVPSIESDVTSEGDGDDDEEDAAEEDGRSRCESICGECGKSKFDVALPSATRDTDVEDDEEPCSDPDCDCHIATSDDDSVAGINEEPSTCTCGPCQDSQCRRCIEHPDHFQPKPDRQAGNVINLSEEYHHPEDLHHIDTEEVIGMIYETAEPAILRASKEIRDQCLPVYHSQNALSWRFDWTGYHRSCTRFKAWARSILPENVKLITKVTFEGRHMIERVLNNQ